MNKKTTIDGPIYDARQLGTPKMLLLGLQHMFAMFGATVLVPALTGLDVATALLFAGIGTLLFHLLTGGKVPAFLGSSFAFIGGYNAIRTIGAAADGSPIYDNALLPYACFGVLIAGLMYVVLSVLFKTFGVKKVMRFFPPIVTGPIIIAIGLTLSSSAINNCKANWLVAIVAIAIVIGFNMWGKGMTKIIPILSASSAPTSSHSSLTPQSAPPSPKQSPTRHGSASPFTGTAPCSVSSRARLTPPCSGPRSSP